MVYRISLIKQGNENVVVVGIVCLYHSQYNFSKTNHPDSILTSSYSMTFDLEGGPKSCVDQCPTRFMAERESVQFDFKKTRTDPT